MARPQATRSCSSTGPRPSSRQTGAELTYTVPTAGRTARATCTSRRAQPARTPCPDDLPEAQGDPRVDRPTRQPAGQQPADQRPEPRRRVRRAGDVRRQRPAEWSTSPNAVEQAVVPAARTAASLAHTPSHSHARTRAHSCRCSARSGVDGCRSRPAPRNLDHQGDGREHAAGDAEIRPRRLRPARPSSRRPPAPPSPPGPQGPAPPPAPAGDTVVLGVSLPLLVLAVAAGVRFACTRMRRGSAPAAGGPVRRAARRVADAHRPVERRRHDYAGPSRPDAVGGARPGAQAHGRATAAARRRRTPGRLDDRRRPELGARRTTTTRRRSSRSGLFVKPVPKRRAAATVASPLTWQNQGEACLASSLINSKHRP